MNLSSFINILLIFSGVSIAEKTDDLCLTQECIETAALISESIDNTVNPCDDFYQYSCGNWQKDHPKINNLEGWSHFSKLNHEMLDNLIKLVSNSSVKSEAPYTHSLINFFKGCINTKSRNLNEKTDFQTIKSVIARIGGFPLVEGILWNSTKFSIENALIELNKFMVSRVFLSIDVIKDLRNNSKPLLSIGTPFQPSRFIDGIYRIPKEEGKSIYTFYDVIKTPAQQVSEALKGSVIDPALWTQDMRQVQSLDASIRKIVTPMNNVYSVFQNYDTFKIMVKDLSQFKKIDYIKVINGIIKNEGLVLNESDIIIADVAYLKALDAIIQPTTVFKRALANMLSINIAMILGKFGSTNITKIISTPDLSVLPQQCMTYTEQLLPDLIGRYYMDKMFAKESINDMKEFIASLKDAFHQILEENEWMDSSTKSYSIKKLNAITEHIAFPDYASNDTELLQYHLQFVNISENSFMDTMIKTFGIQRSRNTNILKGSIIKGHWPSTASGVIVNAFYNPETNGIYFPGAIAQFPFYQHSRPRTLNLGAIGMVISHEFTHAFDNIGSLFDEKGNLHDWITPQSKLKFSNKTHCFVDQYSKFKYDMGNNLTVSISGSHTLGENIADNGGARIAYRALELYKTKNSGKLLRLPGVLGNRTQEQLFFMSFANIWCSNKSPLAINNQIQRDAHSIENARVIGTLSNFGEFAKAFNCPVGSPMNPVEKCRLW